MSSLAEQRCVPCHGGVEPMEEQQISEMMSKLGGNWFLNRDDHLECLYRFDDFAKAMAFANSIADVAESEGHHPDLHISWGACRVEIWTHKIDGLSESDFFLAAKVDRLRQKVTVGGG